MKILFFVGTRPEAIKIIPLFIHLKKNKVKVEICSTGQHDKLLNDVFEVFSIKPDYTYKAYKQNKNLNTLFSKIMFIANKTIIKSNPSLVFVHGDTLNTFASASAAFNLKIKIAHLEAGLRSFNNYSPWPEEVYRKAVTSLTDIHFAPTKIAKNNLINENIKNNKIYITGNTVIDSLKIILNSSKTSQYFNITFKNFLTSVNFNKDNFNIIVTCHRREQIGPNIGKLCNEIIKISKIKKVKIFFVIHHNPLITNTIKKKLHNNNKICLIDPLRYDYFVNFIKINNLVITDSGGIQEELTYLNIPCIINRDTTERVEILKQPHNYLVGANSKNMYLICKKLIKNKQILNKQLKYKNAYGVGNASYKITRILFKIFKNI